MTMPLLQLHMGTRRVEADEPLLTCTSTAKRVSRCPGGERAKAVKPLRHQRKRVNRCNVTRRMHMLHATPREADEPPR